MSPYCLMLQVVNAAVIVDPLSRQIIASASDETCRWQNSLSNTKLECCNDLLATLNSTQLNANGSIDCDKHSASELSSDNQCSQSYAEVSCLYPWRWTSQGGTHGENSLVRCGSNNLWHPLRHAPLVAIEKAAARDRHLFPSSGSLGDLSHPNETLQDYSNIFPAKRQKTNNPEVSLQLLFAYSFIFLFVSNEKCER